MRNYNRAKIICETCEVSFEVPHYRRNKAKFCSKKCKSSMIAKKHLNNGPKPWAAANLDGHRHKSATRFSKGQTPWNKDVKGLHLSPKSEFKEGHSLTPDLPIGAVTIRHRKREKTPRAWVKVGCGDWRERARVVWEASFGPIQTGIVIHHKDRNPLNDDIENLQAMTRREHAKEHEQELRGARNA